MKIKVLPLIICLVCLLFIIFPSFGQLTGIKSIPGDYASVSSAVTALNTAGVGTGGVTFNVAANYTETITTTISLTATGTVANPIVFQKDISTTGANPLITAYTGGVGTPGTAVQDGIWRLVGSDYVTINGIDVTDNPANTSNPSTMEYGYALYKASTSNGCQNDTIKNCVITLSNINNTLGIAPMADGSTGIIVMNALPNTATTLIIPIAGGTNSNNKFYGNTIQNCNTGIALIGYAALSPFTLADAGNDVGGNASSTGNTIINYGGAAGAVNPAAAIRTLAQYGLNVSYNTINNNNGSGTNHPNTLRGIYINTATSANVTITYNTITVKGGGTTQAVEGIENAAGSTPASNTINISNNTITNCTYNTATTGGFYGIFNNAASPATLTINNNTISNNSSAATTTGFFYGIQNSGIASTVTISGNIFSGNATAALTTGVFSGISNSVATPSLTITNNTLTGNATTATTGLYYAILNSGAVTTTININSNNVGNGTTGAFTFNAANSGAQLFINNTAGGASANLSISNNNVQGVTYAVAGTGTNSYISNTAITLTQAINGNTFTNLNVNTSGSITFIANSVAVPATGTQNVNSNVISGTFTKAAGGTLTLFTSAATSVSGSVINNNSNNFSNITVSGATVIAGWVNTDAGASAKTIQNNTFSNWAGGTGAITTLSVNITGVNNATTGNAINNISGAGVVVGITTGAGNDNIYSNTINTLASTGASAVTAIAITAGTAKNIYKNKIYDISNSNAGGTVNGILVSGGITVNVYNNLIGDLRAPAASAVDPIRGISVTSATVSSTINVYYNTVYINATSTGTNFGSTGIYHTANATATTAALNLRNNIITNTSTPNGTGLTVAYRRSSTVLTNYSATSNNNLFYGGTAGATRLIFYDGTNSDQTLAAYKTTVSTRDAQSVSEDLITSSKFLSTAGSSASFLHLDPTKATQAESGAVNIAGVTTDFDGQTRQGNTGYSGTGTAPDIGADEVDGILSSALSGTYNVGAGQTFTSLTNAGGLFAAINTLGLSGNVIVNITSDLTEDGTNSLYQWVEQGIGNYTLTIKPDSSTVRTISGNVLTGMIRLTGAKRVTIDGSNGTTGNYLTFRNINTTGTTGTAFTFINGATNNTIKYCNVEAYANATNGVILFSTSAVTGGNSINTISNCGINATVNSNTGNVCIYSAGTVGNENSSNSISNNNIYNYRDRALDITATGSTGWTISGNSFYNGDVSASIDYAAASTLHGIRILGGKGYLISNNYLGGNAASAGGTSALYSSSLGNVSFQGIMLTTTGSAPASNVKGNTIANITLSSVPTAAGSIAFDGIVTSGSGINIGGALAGDGNIIGSNAVNSSISVTTATTAAAKTTTINGINCTSTGGVVIGNQVAGIDINNIGAAPAPSTFTGINISNATAPSQVNNNIIGSTGAGAASNSIQVLSSSTATKTNITGIAIAATVTSAVQVDGNIIQNLSHLSTVTTLTTGGVIGISNASTGASAITITNNTVTSLSISTYTTGVFYGITNSAACDTISINTNTINGNTTPSASGVYFAIYNSGAVTSAININSNNIGNSTTGAFTFSTANSGNQIFINNTAGTATAALSISNNNFQGITYSVAGSGNNTCILNSAATLSQAINGNTFTSLNINTTGNIIFISNSVVVPATGTQNVNSNSIVGTFTKAGVGTVTLFTSAASSLSGSVINNNSNNFSNITVAGAAVIAGWVNTDGGASVKTIQNNTFSNWTGGIGAITALSVNLTGTNNSTTGNAINNISSAGAITGIATNAGNDKIYSNIINTLSTTGASAVDGISITGGTTTNIYKNKIYDLQANNATGTVNGILVSGATIVTINIFNNLIGDLRTPIENSATDAIRGISVTATALNSAINVYYNTVYLNATSTGAAFGTTGIYHTTGIATTASLNLRNNSITNTSTPKGTGLTVAYRRSSTVLTNYASTSNNNLFYGGTPGTTQLIFYDATNKDQALSTYKTRVANRDSISVTENLTAKYLSTSGSSSVFLHMDSTIASLIVSAAANIAGFTDDFDGQIRAGNPGYTGSSSSPDIGADEIFGIENIPPTITYTLLTNTTSTVNRSVTGVVITDGSGVNVATGTKPRIYYKRVSDANVWLDNTSTTNGWKYTEATNSSTPFTFTIDYSLLNGGATVMAGVIQYFIVAQDVATTANIGINSGTFAATPSSVGLTSAAFPIGGTINSYNIPFSGNYNVGTGEVFTSLTKADGLFASINSAGLMGNTTFNITSDLAEDGTNALNQWTESGVGNYILTIQPDAVTLRTISGNVAGGLIRLNGADRVTIDGSNGGSGSYLSFKNTNPAGTTGTAFTFISGATNNTIRYCDVEAFANATNGVILFSTSIIAGGNSNNLIDNCTINATLASNTGNVAIYSAGTAGNENSSNTISNNSIYGYRDRGLDINATGSTAWTISGNSFYNGYVSGTINYASSSTLHGIRVLGGSGYSILNNYIGGNGILASGTNAIYSSTLGNLSYQGILLTTSSSSPASYVKGNTIAAISLSSVPTAANSNAFIGIETNGSGINIGGSSSGDGNTIGSNTSNGSIAFTSSTISTSNTTLIRGINCASTGGLIIGNQVGGFDISNIGTAPAASTFQGIYVNSATAPSQVNNNIIGSAATSNNIRVLSVSSATTTSLTGISVGTSVNSAIQINGNAIENISHLSTTSSGTFAGISNNASSGAAIITISNDTIQNISTVANGNSGSSVYTGISSGTTSTISNNIITNIVLSSTGTNAQITGINVSGPFIYTISGNTISSLSTASARTSASVETGSPAASAVIGILNAATVTGQVISNNILLNFSSTTTAVLNTVITGIGIASTASGNIFNNRIAGFTNMSTGSSPGICGVVAANGLFDLYNNSVKLDNSVNVNGVNIYGIIHAAGNNWNYYYNTVSIGGNSTGTPLRSAAFIRPVDGNLFLRNNVFVNTRTGTGLNYAISNLVAPPNSTWSSTASNYNDLFSSNANTTGEWGLSTNITFAQWQTASGGEANSVNKPVSFIVSAYDLQPDSITNCALNNSGTPITTPIVINTDINSTSRSSISPDMGAYEFNYTLFVASAGNNSPVCSGSLVSLTSDPGVALKSTYSWTDPNGIIVSSAQNPNVTALAGTYTVTVTDGNGCYDTATTVITLTSRPTGTLSSPSFVCSGNSATLSIAVTGSGTISGTLSSGDIFTGTTPTITVSVSPSSTTSYFITTLTDGNCTSQASDYPDTVRVRITQNGEWTGASGTNWNDAGNWCGGVPTNTTDITIPSGLTNYPVISSLSGTNNIIISSGASLINSSTLQIGGTISNSGTFNAANGTIEMNGSIAQTIPANTFVSNSVDNLIISNTSAGGVTLGGALDVYGSLTYSGTGMKLTTNDTLTLKSTALNTASIGDMTGNTITGKVTVERYISAHKAWRLLSVPTNTTQTIQQAWQEGCGANQNCVVNFGTQITGTGGPAAGFDVYTATPSLKTYKPTTNNWAGIANTNTAGITTTEGYMIFIRGDRTAIAFNSVPIQTVLRTKGSLYTGDQAPIPVSAGKFASIGNPYASALDMRYITKTGVKDFFYVWDPNLGGNSGLGAYQTFSYNGSDYVITPGMGSYGSVGSVSNYIESGQAFLIQADSIGGGSLIFKEGDKTSGSAQVSAVAGLPQPQFRASLYGINADNSTYMIDGTLSNYDDSYSNSVDDMDAIKSTNTSENLSIKTANTLLVIERRHTIISQDTIFLNLTGTKIQKYRFEFTADQLGQTGLTGFFEDTYLHTSMLLNLTGSTVADFNIENIPGSYAPDRFRIVFSQLATLPVSFTSIKAYQKNKDIAVEWKVENESNLKQYDVEKSVDGNHYAIANTVAASNAALGNYSWLDVHPSEGYNYYRILSTDVNGKIEYSTVVKVLMGKEKQTISIYPNPVTDGLINLQLTNEPEGNYGIRLLNKIGQVMISKQINHAEGSSTETIRLDRYAAHGIYQLEVTKPDGNTVDMNVVY